MLQGDPARKQDIVAATAMYGASCGARKEDNREHKVAAGPSSSGSGGWAKQLRQRPGRA